ncbi:hypothetical protein FJY84_05125 [Candidatus Bathyarchaeota archaeon]|nr:hypothetical protein [Candidatus Bathyarchaeota archaeon]
MSTLSETFQEVFKKRECPFLMKCDVEVVKHFFNQICKSQNYKNCINFAKRTGELHAPIYWLQKYAIDESNFIEEKIIEETY